MTKTVTLQVRLEPGAMAELDEIAKVEGVSRSTALRHVLEWVVSEHKAGRLGKIPSSGTEMYDRLDKMHADKKPHVSLVHDINDIEIVGSDGGWE